MRRFWLALLAFFGTAFIAAAIAIPTYLVPKLKVVPLDLDITSVANTVDPDGGNERFPAVVFDRCSVGESKARTLDANLTQQRRSVIVEPSNSEQATVQSAQTVMIDRTRDADGEETEPTAAAADEERDCNDALLSSTIDRVSVNRKTSAPNGEVSSLQLAAVTGDGTVEDVSVPLDDRKGFQYKFGFDVKKKSYYYYDLNTRSDNPAEFVGEETIDGLKVYHFVSEVPETDLSELPDANDDAPLGTILNMPAKWWGITGKGVKRNDMYSLHRYATATRHVYVEPVTGTIVNGREDQHFYFRYPDADDDSTPKAVRDFRMDALKATFQWSDQTVSQQVDRAEKYVNLLKWGGLYVPIILGVLGAVLLLTWALLIWRGRKTTDGDDPGGDGEENGDGPRDGGPAGGADGHGDDFSDLPTEVTDAPTTEFDPAGAYPSAGYGTPGYAVGGAAAGGAGAAGYAGGRYAAGEAPNQDYTDQEYAEQGYTEQDYIDPGYYTEPAGGTGYADDQLTDAYTEPLVDPHAAYRRPVSPQEYTAPDDYPETTTEYVTPSEFTTPPEFTEPHQGRHFRRPEDERPQD